MLDLHACGNIGTHLQSPAASKEVSPSEYRARSCFLDLIFIMAQNAAPGTAGTFLSGAYLNILRLLD